MTNMTNTFSDAEIYVADSRDREDRAAEFDSVALPHLNALYRTATRLLGDRTQAEDVVQEVYLLAWRSFHRFEAETDCRAWLFKIMFNSIHYFRRKWLDRFVAPSEENWEQGLMAAAPVVEQLTDEDILAALEEIPRDFRAVVLLADVEGFSYKEVAEMLKVPIGTVMSRLSRARRLLRERLAGVAHSYGIGKTAQDQAL